MQRIFVGDVQGCADEFDELLARAEREFGEEFCLWVAGDLINRGPENLRPLERVRELVSAGRAQYVLGNHESCGAIDKGGIRSIWHHPDDNQFIPDNYFEFDYPEQNLRFIVLDSQYEPDGTDKKPLCIGYAEGYIPRQQLQWLREQLEDARRKDYQAIIFNHQILAGIHYPYGISNAGEVQKLIESYSDVVRVAFHGHLHDNFVQRQNDVTYVSVRRSVADLSAGWAKRSGDWLLVEVYADNRIEITGHGAVLSLRV